MFSKIYNNNEKIKRKRIFVSQSTLNHDLSVLNRDTKKAGCTE